MRPSTHPACSYTRRVRILWRLVSVVILLGLPSIASAEAILAMSPAAVETLLARAGWRYARDSDGGFHMVFAGEDGRPDRAVYLAVECTSDGEPWGITFHHVVGPVGAGRANEDLELLLRFANDFNATRAFGKVFLSPQDDGSWVIRFVHSFDFSGGIIPSSFLNPLMLLLREIEGLYDRFFPPGSPSILGP